MKQVHPICKLKNLNLLKGLEIVDQFLNQNQDQDLLNFQIKNPDFLQLTIFIQKDQLQEIIIKVMKSNYHQEEILQDQGSQIKINFKKVF